MQTRVTVAQHTNTNTLIQGRQRVRPTFCCDKPKKSPIRPTGHAALNRTDLDDVIIVDQLKLFMMIEKKKIQHQTSTKQMETQERAQ